MATEDRRGTPPPGWAVQVFSPSSQVLGGPARAQASFPGLQSRCVQVPRSCRTPSPTADVGAHRGQNLPDHARLCQCKASCFWGLPHSSPHIQS